MTEQLINILRAWGAVGYGAVFLALPTLCLESPLLPGVFSVVPSLQPPPVNHGVHLPVWLCPHFL